MGVETQVWQDSTEWMLKGCDLSLPPEGTFTRAFVQLFGGRVQESFLFFSTWRASALFPEPEELTVEALSPTPSSLFVSPDNTGVCVLVSAWTGGEAANWGVKLSRLLAGLEGGMCVELARPSSPESRLRR